MTLFPDRPFAFDSDAFGTGRVADTSLEAFREVVTPTIKGRQQNVLMALAVWGADGRSAPTAGELFAFMRERGWAQEIGEVRPRLTELSRKGSVIRGEARMCQARGLRAHTWYSAEEK